MTAANTWDDPRIHRCRWCGIRLTEGWLLRWWRRSYCRPCGKALAAPHQGPPFPKDSRR